MQWCDDGSLLVATMVLRLDVMVAWQWRLVVMVVSI